MQKLLILLILALFSSQGLAGSCPDASEPIKTISADGSHFESKCLTMREVDIANTKKITEANAKKVTEANAKLVETRNAKKVSPQVYSGDIDPVQQVNSGDIQFVQTVKLSPVLANLLYGIAVFTAIMLCLGLFFSYRIDSKKAKDIQSVLSDEARKAELKEEERAQKELEQLEREEEKEELRLQELAKQAERDRIYALQQKKLVYLKADKYLAEFESHLPFHLSAGYSDLRIIYDEKSSLTQVSLSENQTSFKDGKLWEMLISLLVSDHPLDTMSTIYFAKIRSLLDDENYLVIGETSLEINEFFDRSTQLELVDLISTSLMPKPIALFVVLHLSREFRYPNEEERAESEFKLLHFIIKENSKVKVQKLFTKLDEYATQCVDSYADVSSKEYDQLESNQEAYIKEDEVEEESEEGYEVDEEAIEKAVKNTKLPKS